MQKQIRINKTPEMESILLVLKAKKYPLLEENEIVKYLLSRDFSNILQTHSLPTERTTEEKEEIQNILNKIYQVVNKQKLAEKWFKKKRINSKKITEEQILDLLYDEDEKGDS